VTITPPEGPSPPNTTDEEESAEGTSPLSETEEEEPSLDAGKAFFLIKLDDGPFGRVIVRAAGNPTVVAMTVMSVIFIATLVVGPKALSGGPVATMCFIELVILGLIVWSGRQASRTKLPAMRKKQLPAGVKKQQFQRKRNKRRRTR
jgi:hypothetical protein